jgi:hypothetical protein
MPLKPNIPESPSWPASPVLRGASFPASPSLEDLGDPEWVAAYEAAGGHVRRVRNAAGSQQAALVGPLVEPLSRPNPNFLRILEGGRTKASPAVDPGLHEDVNRLQDFVASDSPSNPAVVPEPARRDAPPSRDGQEDAVFADLQGKATAWLDIFCPKVNQCMRGAHDAITRDDEESLAHGALSLRRALVALADYVEPGGAGTRPDHTGEERKVGQEQFKNRLYIYLGKKLENSHRRALTLAELDLIDPQLNSFVRALGKAVHADSPKDDLAQIYLTTWSVVAQVVHCSEPRP